MRGNAQPPRRGQNQPGTTSNMPLCEKRSEHRRLEQDLLQLVAVLTTHPIMSATVWKMKNHAHGNDTVPELLSHRLGSADSYQLRCEHCSLIVQPVQVKRRRKIRRACAPKHLTSLTRKLPFLRTPSHLSPCPTDPPPPRHTPTPPPQSLPDPPLTHPAFFDSTTSRPPRPLRSPLGAKPKPT